MIKYIRLYRNGYRIRSTGGNHRDELEDLYKRCLYDKTYMDIMTRENYGPMLPKSLESWENLIYNMNILSFPKYIYYDIEIIGSTHGKDKRVLQHTVSPFVYIKNQFDENELSSHIYNVTGETYMISLSNNIILTKNLNDLNYKNHKKYLYNKNHTKLTDISYELDSLYNKHGGCYSPYDIVKFALSTDRHIGVHSYECIVEMWFKYSGLSIEEAASMEYIPSEIELYPVLRYDHVSRVNYMMAYERNELFNNEHFKYFR